MHIKGNIQHNEKTPYGMGENICKTYTSELVFLQRRHTDDQPVYEKVLNFPTHVGNAIKPQRHITTLLGGLSFKK